MPSRETIASNRRVQGPGLVQEALKRGFDLLVSSLVILGTLPLWGAAALLIPLESRGPVFYRGPRVGRGGRVFQMYKFRSMAVGGSEQGLLITSKGDPRVTRVGRFLRATKLDELPQLLNVLKGEMSIVGPRPEHPYYVARYTEEQRRLLTVRPGVTSPATLKYRHEETLLAQSKDTEALYLEVVLPDKLRVDMEYLDRRSFWYDLKLVLQTLRALPRWKL